jgi:chromosomal replication initiation ATPase DnaA
MQLVALEKKEAWETFRDRYGDEGRDVALWLGRRHCGLTLRELGAAAGGITYPAVSRAVRAIEQRRKKDAGLCRLTDRLETQLLNI